MVNRNTVKVSYSTMPNMAQQIKQHNNKVLDSGQVEKSGGCNGHRGEKQCPVPGDCMAKGVVYGAEVTDLTTGTKETYTGLTDGMRATSVTVTNLAPDFPTMSGS